MVFGVLKDIMLTNVPVPLGERSYEILIGPLQESAEQLDLFGMLSTPQNALIALNGQL